MSIKKIILIFLIAFACFSCTEVQHSASQAFDNANSVVKSGSKNVWHPPAEKQKEQDNTK